MREYSQLHGLRPARADALKKLAILYLAGKAPKAEALAVILNLDVNAIFADPGTLRDEDAMIRATPVRVQVHMATPATSRQTAATECTS